MESQIYKIEKFNEYINEKYGYTEFFKKYNVPVCEALKQFDNLSYDDEFEQWKISNRNELLSINSSKDNFNQLVEIVRKRKIVPFIGSGLSAPMGLPTWVKYLLDLANELMIEEKILDYVNKNEFEEAAQFISENIGEINFNSRVDSKFVMVSPKIKGIINLLPKLTNGTIVTTNFDKLIEKVFTNHGKPLTIIHGKDNREFHRYFARGDDCLLKLHGSVYDTNLRVFTKSEYESAYIDDSGNIDFQKPLPENLSKIYKNATLLFLGCSLENDRTMQLFKTIMNQESEIKIPRHYAFLSSPEKSEDLIQKENFLREHSILPIWYPKGKYEILDNMIELLLYEVENEL